jgi:drug/metabolite transporter (DMT)-like permease
MVVATLCFACMHTSIRHVGDSGIHPFEIAFFRNAFGMLAITPWLIRYGLTPFHTQKFGLHCLRAGINVVAMLCFFTALTITPVTEVTALSFTAPIFATILATIVFGEKVGIRRWSATIVGFSGVLLILRPGFQEIGTGQILVMMSTMVWACALMVIKVLGKTESSVTITAYMSLLMTPITLVPALFVWTWPEPYHYLWFMVIGICGGAGQMMVAEALKSASTSVVMPFDFFKLIWVAVIAYLAFGEVADLFTWAGGIIIFCATAYITYRERKREVTVAPKAEMS